MRKDRIWIRKAGKYRLFRNDLATDIIFDVEQDEEFTLKEVKTR